MCHDTILVYFYPGVSLFRFKSDFRFALFIANNNVSEFHLLGMKSRTRPVHGRSI